MTFRTILSAASALLIITIGTIAPRAQGVVEIRLRGRFFSEPATVRVTVAVEPNQHNRTLVVQADGEQLFRSSEVPLDGDKGQRIHTLEFKNLPAGHYVLRAEVHSNQDLRGVAEQQLIVATIGGEER